MLHLTLRRSRRTRKTRAVRIALAGTLDAGDAALLDDTLRTVTKTASIVIVDLRGLQAMESEAITPIVRADVRVRADGGRLVVVRGGMEIERCFTRAGVDGLLEVVDRPPDVAELGAGWSPAPDQARVPVDAEAGSS